MASDGVNGVYGNQYGQPAELAASTPAAPAAPAHAATASIASTTGSSVSPANKPQPNEVGWFFVEQYYTTLSKNPNKISLFYSKKSQLVNGWEAQQVLPAVGTKAINEKFKSLDFQDCKVRVLNVDSQASFSNLVIQVIGEISNKGEPHNKFVQTFVLAEQPNGYFVLNDIFRYLNTDENEIIEDEPEQEEATPQEITQPVESVPRDADDIITTKAAPEEVEERLEETAAVEEEPEPAVEPDPVEEEAAFAPEESETAEEPIEEPIEEPTEEPTAPEPMEEKSVAPESTLAQSPPKATTPAPATEAAPARKTWASMVGTKAPAVPALPAAPAAIPSQPRTQRLSQPPANSKPTTEPASTESAEDTLPTQSNGWQNVDGGKKQKGPQAKSTSEQVTLAYIKNVNEKVDARILREVLEKFGELKYFDVSRPRNCAFVEFAEPAGYAAAVGANPHDVGGETIYVEERRPRPNAYGGSSASFTRGGSTTSRGRGGTSMQGRSGSQTGNYPKETTRGTFQQRGSKSGNITPRGRGQAQVA